jgi:hypothetical protein
MSTTSHKVRCIHYDTIIEAKPKTKHYGRIKLLDEICMNLEMGTPIKICNKQHNHQL